MTLFIDGFAAGTVAAWSAYWLGRWSKWRAEHRNQSTSTEESR